MYDQCVHHRQRCVMHYACATMMHNFSRDMRDNHPEKAALDLQYKCNTGGGRTNPLYKLIYTNNTIKFTLQVFIIGWGSTQ